MEKVKSILKCSECKEVINETKFMTPKEMIGANLMMTLTSVFAGSCPKGCQPTYSDCNLRTVKVYETDCGKTVSYDDIKRALAERVSHD